MLDTPRAHPPALCQPSDRRHARGDHGRGPWRAAEGGLTEHRCKPRAPLGGKFASIDFVLSNCVNSGIRRFAILTQYKAQSLIQHVERGWSYLRGESASSIEVIPAQQQIGELWYRGTADAVYQNMEIILSHRPSTSSCWPGPYLQDGLRSDELRTTWKGADITVGVVEVPRDQRFISESSPPPNGTA